MGELIFNYITYYEDLILLLYYGMYVYNDAINDDFLTLNLKSILDAATKSITMVDLYNNLKGVISESSLKKLYADFHLCLKSNIKTPLTRYMVRLKRLIKVILVGMHFMNIKLKTR